MIENFEKNIEGTMIEKLAVRIILNDYLKIINTRKQITKYAAEKMLEDCSTHSLQQIVRNSPDYQILREKSQIYSEIINDIFELISVFEEEN